MASTEPLAPAAFSMTALRWVTGKTCWNGVGSTSSGSRPVTFKANELPARGTAWLSIVKPGDVGILFNEGNAWIADLLKYRPEEVGLTLLPVSISDGKVVPELLASPGPEAAAPCC